MSNQKSFFEIQRKARIASAWLLVLFILVVCLTIFSVYLVVTSIYVLSEDNITVHSIVNSFFNHLDYLPPLALFISALALYGFIIRYYNLRLSNGRDIIENLGGRFIPPNTTNPDEKKLINIVEEMAIASGINVPTLYVFDNEFNVINAITTGFRINNTTIGVTKGALEYLNRDELQGVIAHEFSHIFHKDVKLNLNLVSWSFGLIVIFNVGTRLINLALRSSKRYYFSKKNNKNNLQGAVLLLGIAMCICGGIGYLCSLIVKFAISRQREFLADATAVQYTRNPFGIGSALLKIANEQSVLYNSAKAVEASHMFFAEGIKRFFSFRLLSSHPPLHKRIKAISPNLLQLLSQDKSTVNVKNATVKETKLMPNVQKKSEILSFCNSPV